MNRIAFTLPIFSALFACSSATNEPVVEACPESVPRSVSVSEGGQMVLPRVAGITYVADAGAEVSDEAGKLVLRIGYLQTAGHPSLTASCGRKIPITTRRLAWKSVAKWEEGAGAPGREYGGWWLDAAGSGNLFVYGGYHFVPKQFTPAKDAWRFDLGTNKWIELSGETLPMLPGGRVAAIPDTRSVWYFGGTIPTADGSVDPQPSLYRLDYSDSAVRPTRVDAISGAPGSYTGAFLFDAKRNRWLSICGVDAAVGVNCNVNAYSEQRGFERIKAAGKAPSGRFGFAYAYDKETDRVVLFGGQTGNENLDIDGETWSLELSSDPPEWKMIFGSSSGPRARRNGAFALDEAGHRFFLFGGTPDGKTSTSGVQVLNLDRGREFWKDLDLSEAPARTSGIAAYDSVRGQILMGFGNNPRPMRDLWALDVANANPR